MLTTQTIDHADKAGRAFLRKVAKGNWRANARRDEDWRLTFTRTIEGEIGEPDEEVVVDSGLTVRDDVQPGMRQSFDDSEPVTMQEPRSVYLHAWDADTLAVLLLKFPNASLKIRGSSGSANSSKIGLTFYSLELDLGERYTVTIGGETIACHGRTVCGGAITI